jgi:hypothetical protein
MDEPSLGLARPALSRRFRDHPPHQRWTSIAFIQRVISGSSGCSIWNARQRFSTGARAIREDQAVECEPSLAGNVALETLALP